MEVAGELAAVTSVRIYSNVSNYYARTAIGSAYGLRAVDHRGMRPSRWYGLGIQRSRAMVQHIFIGIASCSNQTISCQRRFDDGWNQV